MTARYMNAMQALRFPKHVDFARLGWHLARADVGGSCSQTEDIAIATTTSAKRIIVEFTAEMCFKPLRPQIVRNHPTEYCSVTKCGVCFFSILNYHGAVARAAATVPVEMNKNDVPRMSKVNGSES